MMIWRLFASVLAIVVNGKQTNEQRSMSKLTGS